MADPKSDVIPRFTWHAPNEGQQMFSEKDWATLKAVAASPEPNAFMLGRPAARQLVDAVEEIERWPVVSALFTCSRGRCAGARATAGSTSGASFLRTPRRCGTSAALAAGFGPSEGL